MPVAPKTFLQVMSHKSWVLLVTHLCLSSNYCATKYGSFKPKHDLFLSCLNLKNTFITVLLTNVMYLWFTEMSKRTFFLAIGLSNCWECILSEKWDFGNGHLFWG